jgi:5'-nucleotidase (lipoprotein e(P4) family)
VQNACLSVLIGWKKYFSQGGNDMKHHFYKHVIVSGLLILLLATIPNGLWADSHDYTSKDLNEQTVMGMLWYQRAAEMRALCYQAFNTAKLIFDLDLEKNGTGKKRAVVVDIDETVLDNSPYNAGFVDKDIGYPTGFAEWVNAAKADVVPGAVGFLNYVVEKGADVFYITNRKIRFKEATIKNMKALGFPQLLDDHLLMREKSSDKEARRQIVRKNHRIVLLMGDNLNDFDSIFRKKGIDGRSAAVDTVKDKFGAQFIVLPNPMYGDWEGAAYDFNWKLTPKQKSEARKKLLKRWNQ